MANKLRSIKREIDREQSKPNEIQVRLETLLKSRDALAALVSQKLSARPAFELGKLLAAAQKELEVFEATRKKLVEQYGGKWDEKARQFVFDPPENERKLNETDYKQLIETEVTMTVPRVTVDSLDTQGVKLTGAESMLLNWLIVED